MSTATHEQKRKFENGRAWRWLSKTVIGWNPICQAIENGDQCHNPSCITHHLVDPEVCWELRSTVSNLCAVCPKHHAGGALGDNNRLDYLPTREAGVMGEPDVYHVHKTVEARKCTTTTQPDDVWEALAVRERVAAAEWQVWKARQTKTTAEEKSNPTREATDQGTRTDIPTATQ